jgi:hypothetical protein
MAPFPPYPHRVPKPDEYLELGQKENPLVWLPVWVGMQVVVAMLIVATIMGRI